MLTSGRLIPLMLILCLLLGVLSSCEVYRGMDGKLTRVGAGIERERQNYLKLVSKERVFSESELAELNNTTTIFFLGRNGLPHKSEFEKAVNSVWNLTKVEFVDARKAYEYESGNYSFFMIDAFIVRKVISSQASSYEMSAPLFYFTLKIPKYSTGRKGVQLDSSLHFGRVDLFSDLETTTHYVNHTRESATSSIYQYGRIKNWTPGMLKIYVSEIQKNLLNTQVRPYAFSSFKTSSVLKPLATDTLFIPAYFLENNPPYSRKIVLADSNYLLRTYKYPYKIISPELLSKRILAGDSLYIFDFVRNGDSNAFIKIQHAYNGLLYQHFKDQRVNVRQIDFTKISNLIGKNETNSH